MCGTNTCHMVFALSSVVYIVVTRLPGDQSQTLHRKPCKKSDYSNFSACGYLLHDSARQHRDDKHLSVQGKSPASAGECHLLTDRAVLKLGSCLLSCSSLDCSGGGSETGSFCFICFQQSLGA